jgi:nucleoside-diphosphate-sugar epimerase
VTALVAGAGYVGGALAEALARGGGDVLVLRRSAQPPPPGTRPFRADLAAPGALDALPPVAVAFYTAAADERSDAAYRRAYVDGLARLIERLARQPAPPRRLLFTSSTSVYAQREGEWVDEASPTEPREFPGRRLLEAEALLRAAPFPCTALRLGGIYGPGRTSLVARAARGERGGPAFTNRIHRDDAAAALAHLAALPDAAPCYVGVDCEPAPEAEVLAWLAQRLGAPAAAGAAPRPAAAGEAPPAPEGETPRPRPRGSKRCRNARLLASGYRFRYPTYREGYAALLAAKGA